MDNEALLVMESVTKRYKNRLVIDQFQLTAKKGEIIALCGPNGVGKSTIIKMICGIIRPSAGTIIVNGQSCNHNRKRYAKEISYLPDSFSFHQPLTVNEFLMYYASVRNVSKDQVLQAVERVGLMDKKDEYISTLSKGMGQRLLLAQTLFSNASLLLFDEPTNGLDNHWLIHLRELLCTLKEENKTVLFSTHIESFAVDVSDRVVYIK